MPASFSRLQLAAALIEYDNDLEDPEKPKRSAQESAIFLPFRNRPLRPPAPERRSTDYLGVALPSETGSIAPRDSLAFDRRSRASIDALRNPFARESTYEGGLDDDEEEELEVDLASWGLDALVPKDKPKHSRKKTKSDALPNPYEQSVPVREVGKPHAPHTRAMSVNMLNGLGDGGAFLDSHSITPPPLGPRRHSIGDPLNVPTSHSADNMFPPRSRSRSPSAHALIDNLPLHSPLHSVPFPSSETVRSPSPQADGAERPRAQSSLSMGSRALLNDDLRFDPRSARGRTLSSGSMSNMLVAEPQQADEDNPFALRPPSPSRMSRFDPKAQRARTISQGTLATQMMLDDRDAQLERDVRPPHDRRYSRMELMRPKVLIMPSPLQSQSTSSAQPGVRAKEGFELSTDGRPLPPGARAARRSSVTLSVLEPGLNATPVASNSFTPNPRSSLTLSQLVFRNTLMVDGERDVAYADIEGHIKRATEDGEKVELESEPEPEIAREVPIVQVEEPGQKRPVGKLYGRSLIDDLEARKAEMRGKQRVFRGDERPSMMARSSTLINPDELKRPTSQHLASFNSQPNLTRRNSVNAKPLLEFEEELPGAPRKSMLLPGSPSAGGNTRSVFGVDTVWQRELAKLKVIEEQERREEEARKQREAAEEAKNAKKRGKKKGKGRDGDEPSPALTGAETLSPALNASPGGSDEKPPTPPHVLPEIPKTVRRRPPPPGEFDDESDEESDDSDAPAPPRRAPQTSGWHSDEEEEGPRRTTGTGPRYPQSGPPRLPQVVPQDDDSSEEDVPLVATIGRAAQRQTRLGSTAADDSSDEDKPLTALLDKTRQKLPSLGGSQLSPTSLRPGPADDDEDEDDMPLGLRASRIPPGFGAGGDDDDDKPLGMHPEQLRKSQFFMAAQQQQQQQMLAQAQMAQMQHAMMYATPPSMMGSGYFGPPMPPPMMMYPQLPPTPPPIQDKLGRVDKWRHDVAVEGERS
ncbi:uncharacterized protein TRAVEDRAFT_142971 [Trametes versicolor FP-101664 SS1]|uniref:uncharacterized protein n=1 Tax=Trametes versicolor (strain FP-101664) TaxID=717944 RepID=UPI000462139F|nr:uncharacterized protein TRAVEDRAFT_142971 [Trametes versicolor FP-101664 SS1]EIW61322.1 hypothetical protein TRAVEDRAFT_142971 [Trametes versicolor FP-101664 SS1]